MRVDQVMSTSTGSIHPNDTLLLAAQRMRDFNLGCVTVCDDTSGVVGVVTDRDITLCVANGGDPRVDTGRAVLVNQVLITIRGDHTLDDALMTMMIGRVRRLPVVTGTRLLGVISAADLAYHGVPDAALDAATPA